jgi:hypothetical protein
MPGDRFLPDAVFASAPAGTRVRLTGIIVLTLFPFLIVLNVAVAPARDPVGRWMVALAPLIGLVIMAGTWIGARVRCYRLAGDELLVERVLQTVRFPLDGLQDVTPDRDAFRSAWKIYGNDGLGAVAGRFRSKRLGAFRAYVTDREHAVVLRWPDHCLVVSPQQHTLFIEAVRRRAGLSR